MHLTAHGRVCPRSRRKLLNAGTSRSVEDCRGRWSYMVSEGSPHIRRGYRLGLSFSQCIRSMFQLHNETINVWSHLAGAILFVCLVFYVKDSSAFERPRAMVESVVGSIPFQGRFNVSIFEEEFCGPDDGAEKRENGSNCTAAHDIGNRTMKCKRRNEEMAFSAARRHFAAAKNILQVCAPAAAPLAARESGVPCCPLVSLAQSGPGRRPCLDASRMSCASCLVYFSVLAFGVCVVWEGRKSM